MMKHFFFAMMLVAGFLSLASVTAMAQTRGEVAKEFKGTGTIYDPYLISTAADLRLIADECEEGETFQGKYFQMTNDIVINENVLLEDGEVNAADSAKFEIWKPIGCKSNCYFEGSFDGKRHSISGLYLNGLFSQVRGIVKNLTLKDSYIVDYQRNPYETFNCQTGSIAHHLNGKLFNIITYATVVNGGGICGEVACAEIRRCANLGKRSNCGVAKWINGTRSGTNYLLSKVYDCYNESKTEYGGIAWDTNLNGGAGNGASSKQRGIHIANFINKGDVEEGGGAACRLIFVSMQNYVNIGNVKSGNSIATNINNTYTDFDKTYYLETSANGPSFSKSMTAKQMKKQDFIDELNANMENLNGPESRWVKGEDDYPTFEWIQNFDIPAGWLDNSVKYVSEDFIGEGTEDNPYLISSVADLRLLCANVERGMTYKDDFFKLTTDLVFYHGLMKNGELNGYPSDYEPTPQVSQFYGTFDGNGHTIRGLFEKTLFYYVYGTIKNLHIKGSYVRNGIAQLLKADNNYKGCILNCSFDGIAEYGGIVEYMYDEAQIRECVNYGKAKAGIVYSTGYNSSKYFEIDSCLNCGKVEMAGILGIYNAGNLGAICMISNSVNYGEIDRFTDRNQTGGILGKYTGTKVPIRIYNCHNKGTYKGSTGGVVGCNTTNSSDILKNSSLELSNVVNTADNEEISHCGIGYCIVGNINDAYFLETSGDRATFIDTYYCKCTNVNNMTAKQMKQQSFLDELNSNAEQLGDNYSKWKFDSDGFPTLAWVDTYMTLGIETVNAQEKDNKRRTLNCVYGLSGQMVRPNTTDTSGLPQGIYIVNGKKIVVTQ